VATNGNSENAGRRMEANSVRKCGYRAKEDDSITGCIWVAGFHHVMARSHLAGVLKLMNRSFL
jgi:hypothetical protein